MFKLVEFKERYPNYNLGFFATNPLTKTEELCGLRMHLLFKGNHEYQCFNFPEEYYEELLKRCNDLKENQFCVVGVNDAEFILKKVETSILGWCKQTKERVAIDNPLKFIIGQDEYDELYENYMDGLGGDWEG